MLYFNKGMGENSADFEGIRFVVRAVSDDEFRPALQGIHAEYDPAGNDPAAVVIVGTDGRRLHLYRTINPAIVPGDYKIIVNKNSQVILEKNDSSDRPEFVNWRRVMPDRSVYKQYHRGVCFPDRGLKVEAFSIAVCKVLAAIPDLHINIEYILDLAGRDFDNVWADPTDTLNRAIYFTRNDNIYEALIMPLRQDY